MMPSCLREQMPSPLTTELHVTGMTCNNCARKVTDAVQKVPGVHSLSVNLTTEHASVRWTSGAEKNVSVLLAAISQAGYSAKEISSETAIGESRQSRWEWNLIIGLTSTSALMIGEWI